MEGQSDKLLLRQFTNYPKAWNYRALDPHTTKSPYKFFSIVSIL